jgi:hypothetical protein
MRDLKWPEAIIRVLKDHGKPMPYADIAKGIIEKGYRKSVGVTPAATVASIVSTSIKNEGDRSPFFKPERGVYGLRELTPRHPTVEEQDEAQDDAEEMGLINAFGMFWRRDAVDWKPSQPALNGYSQAGSQEVNFSGQVGVYLLHDGTRVVYVGRVTEPRLGARLRDHMRDRLNGRWDRFSWFGVQKVTDDGKLSASPKEFTLDNLVATMETLLIEGLEPPQNRRQGDGFSAVEFLQASDPELSKQDLLKELSNRLS